MVPIRLMVMSVTDQKTLETYWQQAFEEGQLCYSCHYCVQLNNYHPYGDAFCAESNRDCDVRDLADCPAVQARLSECD